MNVYTDATDVIFKNSTAIHVVFFSINLWSIEIIYILYWARAKLLIVILVIRGYGLEDYIYDN